MESRKIIYKCENCGKKVIAFPSHYYRYKHHYCSKECCDEHRKATGYCRGENNLLFKGGSTMITYRCDYCDKEKTQPIWNYKRYDHHYCSSKCAVIARNEVGRELKLKLLEEEIECACGCGQKLKKYVIDVKDGFVIRERRYICGHTGNIPNTGQFIKGRFVSLESRIRLSCAQRNISVEEFNGFADEGNLRSERKEVKEHIKWRNKIFERDNYMCQLCGAKSGNGYAVILNAHHIKGWGDFPELRRELFNGVTLCRSCHYYAHSKKYQNELGDKFIIKTEKVAS